MIIYTLASVNFFFVLALPTLLKPWVVL